MAKKRKIPKRRFGGASSRIKGICKMRQEQVKKARKLPGLDGVDGLETSERAAADCCGHVESARRAAKNGLWDMALADYDRAVSKMRDSDVAFHRWVQDYAGPEEGGDGGGGQP